MRFSILQPYRYLTNIRAELQVKRPDESGEILDGPLKDPPVVACSD